MGSQQTQGSIVGGVIGAVIGGYFGGPSGAAWGYSLGSALGGYVAAEDTESEGRRVDQLKVQTSTYGRPIPEVLAPARIGGNVFWLEGNRIRETKVETEQGKGGLGPTHTQTTYEYHATFAVGLCEGTIAGVRRVWADSVLIYDGSDVASAESVLAGAKVYTYGAETSDEFSDKINRIIESGQQHWGIKVYTGHEGQEPDPRMQADLGEENVPAYRGLAYLLIEDMPLAEYGNRMPNITVEVAGGVGEPPVYIGEWEEVLPGAGSEEVWPSISMQDGVITAQWFTGTADVFSSRRKVARYSVSGELLDIRGQGSIGEDISVRRVCVNSPHIAVAEWDGAAHWVLNGTVQPAGIQHTANVSAIISRSHPVWSGGDDVYYVAPDPSQEYFLLGKYALLNDAVLAGEPVSGLTNDIDSAPTVVNDDWHWSDHAYLSMGVDGHVWVLGREDSSGDWFLVEFDEDLQEVSSRSWPSMTDISKGGRPFAVWGDYVIGQFEQVGTGTAVMTLDGTWVDTLEEGNGATLVGQGPLLISTQGSATYLNSMSPAADLQPAPVADVLTRLAERAGLEEADIDVSAIEGDIRGYVVSNVGPVQSAIEPVRAFAQFDVVEVGYKLHFVPRGGEPVATLTEDDLAAREPGQELPAYVEERRDVDRDLPRVLGVRYQDVDRDYEQGYQYAARLSTQAVNEQTADLTIAMTAEEAAQLADMLLKERWESRTTYRLSTSMRHARLMPGDVVTVEAAGVAVQGRIAEIDDGRPGLRALTAIADGPGLYSSVATGGAGDVAADGPRLRGPTEAILLDLPPLRARDADSGIYVALSGVMQHWPGGQLYRANDGGSSYDAVVSATSSAAIGRTTDTLPAGPTTAWDRGSSLNVRMISGELSGASDLAVLNGANALAVEVDEGWEIIQFVDAVLEADGSYTLSRLLRGRNGTEWAVGRHEAGGRVVALRENGSIQRYGMDVSEIGLTRQYKGVTFGGSLARAPRQEHSYSGVSLKPFAPVHVRGERDAAGDLTVTWVRRARINGEWRDYTGVPLVEESEAYEVDVMDGDTVVRTLDGLSSPEATYTAAEQTTDFGAPQDAVTLQVYQISADVGRGYAAEATV